MPEAKIDYIFLSSSPVMLSARPIGPFNEYSLVHRQGWIGYGYSYLQGCGGPVFFSCVDIAIQFLVWLGG